MNTNEEIWVLKTRMRMGYKRIAKQLGMTPAAVSNRFIRMRRHRAVPITDARPRVAYIPGVPESKFYRYV